MISHHKAYILNTNELLSSGIIILPIQHLLSNLFLKYGSYISKDLNLGDSLDSFDDIYNVERNITMVQENFTRIKEECFTYNYILTSSLYRIGNVVPSPIVLNAK